MSTTKTTTDTSSDDPDYRYVIAGTMSDFDTRHKAVAVAAKYHNWETARVVAIREDQLTRLHRYPEHLGNKYYGNRNYLATKHGAVEINRESLVRNWNGNAQEEVEAHWEIECPVCYRTHKSDDGSEESRSDLIDTVLGCCDTDWFSPSDWIDSCGVCGDSHRERHECRSIFMRDADNDLDDDFLCVACGWEDIGQALAPPEGSCPECGSNAVTERDSYHGEANE